jgi:hypothetical protein
MGHGAQARRGTIRYQGKVEVGANIGVRVNEIRFVVSFRATVANATAFRSFFFEPKDHLTNGSLVAQFAGTFSPMVRETRHRYRAA